MAYKNFTADNANIFENVRFILKNDELAKWQSSTGVLEKGEIALARVAVNKVDPITGDTVPVPTYLMKVGDGTSTFADLNWLAAPASDVYGWAKAATKPGYTATEIVRGTSTVAADLTKAEEDINTLKIAIGSEGSVASMIEAAINALDVTDTAVEKQFVTAVAEADGKITVTRRALSADDIPTLEIAKINGLQAALDLKAAKTYVDEQDNAIKTSIGTTSDAVGTATVYGAIAGVKATAEAATTVEEATGIANTAVSTFKTGTFDPLAERVTAVETKATNNETAITDLKNTEVKANADAIAQLKSDIGNVANVMNFRGVSVNGEGTTPGHDITDPKIGDVIIYGEAEYVYDESGAWDKFGDASDNATAIAGLQDRIGAVETSLNTGATKQAIDAAQKAADDAQDDADEVNRLIGIINGTGDGSIAKAFEDAKDYADNAVSSFKTTDVDPIAKDIEALDKQINGDDTSIGLASEVNTLAHKVDDTILPTLGSVEGKTGLLYDVDTLKYDVDQLEITIPMSYKQLQTAITDKDATVGTDKGLTFVASVTQNENGEIAVTKKSVDLSTDNLTMGAKTIVFNCGGAFDAE